MRYDGAGIADKFHKMRRLSDATVRLWLDEIAGRIPLSEVGSILDVGCGTGRFTDSLARHFKALVTGVDPSREMLAQAVANTGDPGVRYRIGSAENLPIDNDSVDLLFLSMVYHHIDEPDRAIREFRRVLKPQGCVCIRTFTVEQLGSIRYLEFFPAAREVSRRMLPTRASLIEEMSHGRFELTSHGIVRQMTADSPASYFEKVRSRVYSDLVLIPDADFAIGLEQMQSATDFEDQAPVVEPVDLVVFRATGRV